MVRFSGSALLIGIFFWPVTFCAAAFALWYYSPLAPDEHLERKVPEAQEKQNDDAGSSARTIKSGWMTVRRTYEPLNESYAEYITSGYKSFMSKDPRRNRPKDQFFAILKQTATSVVLFLYDGDPAIQASSFPVDCWAAIDISLHRPELFPIDKKVIDAELFMKKTSICLRPKEESSTEASTASNAPSKDDPAPSQGVTDSLESSKAIPWFFFPKSNYDKEDWLHAFLEAARITDPVGMASSASGTEGALYDPADMAALMENIDCQSDAIPTRWLNAMLGRLFLGVYRTQAVEDYIVGRIVRKLAKVQRPSFLSEIKVREVNVGSRTPLFSKPMLKELTQDGTASMEVNVQYKGDFRITISTVATINLGARFKTYEVALVLAVTLKDLEGTLVFKIKPPPSDRIWMGYVLTHCFLHQQRLNIHTLEFSDSQLCQR